MLSIPAMAWPTAFVMVLVTVGFIAACRWIILPQVREGTYSVHSCSISANGRWRSQPR